uniref:Uncharacterized protein n=1 Tax=Knipowitschia caucasica TaxID=637954 RepID=A0AAV2LUK7_KNICA
MAASHGRVDQRFVDWMASLPASMHTIPLTNLAIPDDPPGHSTSPELWPELTPKSQSESRRGGRGYRARL